MGEPIAAVGADIFRRSLGLVLIFCYVLVFTLPPALRPAFLIIFSIFSISAVVFSSFSARSVFVIFRIDIFFVLRSAPVFSRMFFCRPLKLLYSFSSSHCMSRSFPWVGYLSCHGVGPRLRRGPTACGSARCFSGSLPAEAALPVWQLAACFILV